MPAITPAETPRPVTTAVLLVYALAVLTVISTVVQAFLEPIKPATVPLTLGGIVVTGLLAYYVGRGKNAARVILWVVAAASPLTLANYVVLHLGGWDTGHPSWHFPYEVAAGVLRMGVLAAVAFLLARPAARPYFQPRSPVGATD